VVGSSPFANYVVQKQLTDLQRSKWEVGSRKKTNIAFTMMKSRSFFICSLLLVFIQRNTAIQNDRSPPLECDLYLAESTIPNAGLGIFSAVEKESGETVGNGDICIPLFEIYWHNDYDFFLLMSEYVWDGRVMGMHLEVEGKDVNAYWPGIDCAVNCNLALLNVEKATPMYDEGGLERGRHPGAGAISPYRNGTTYVSRRIPKGGELFKYYGEELLDGFGDICLM
jgi:hypothetical protein